MSLLFCCYRFSTMFLFAVLFPQYLFVLFVFFVSQRFCFCCWLFTSPGCSLFSSICVCCLFVVFVCVLLIDVFSYDCFMHFDLVCLSTPCALFVWVCLKDNKQQTIKTKQQLIFFMLCLHVVSVIALCCCCCCCCYMSQHNK